MEKLGSRFGQRPGRRVGGRRDRRARRLISFVIPGEGVAAMSSGSRPCLDVHGNAVALEAVLADVEAREARRDPRRRRPRAQRPRTRTRAVDALREPRGRRRARGQRQHRHRGRRLRLRGRLPVDDRRRPRHDRRCRRVGPRRSSAPSASTGCDGCPRSGACGPTTTRSCSSATPSRARRPPASTRHSTRASPIERVARTDARVIVCGHTHLPEVRDLGWKLIVNDGIGRLRLRRRPDRVVGADHASNGDGRRGRDPPHGVRRDGRRQRDLGRGASRATSTARRRFAPGSSSDDRQRIGPAPCRGHRDGDAHRARQRRGDHHGTGCVAGRSGIRRIEAFDPSRITSRIAGEVRDFDASRRARPQGHAPDRPLHPVRARRRAARRWTRPGCRSGWTATSPSGPG